MVLLYLFRRFQELQENSNTFKDFPGKKKTNSRTFPGREQTLDSFLCSTRHPLLPPYIPHEHNIGFVDFLENTRTEVLDLFLLEYT